MNTKPNGNMNAAQLVALFADEGRHPNALSYELTRCKLDVLVTLAYRENSCDSPDALASKAYDEIERRGSALSRLLADCPALVRSA